MKYSILFFLVNFLMANDILDYSNGLTYYNNYEYKKAYPIILKEAKRGNKEAQYLVANMLELGNGVKKDISSSIKWYKQASKAYEYVLKHEDNNTTDILAQINNQMDESSEKKGLQFAYSKLDLSSKNVKDEFSKMVNKNFGILPHRTTYVHLASYSNKKYQKYFEAQQSTASDFYDRQVEMEFQISFKKQLSYNLLGFNEFLSLGYTQQVWWQIYQKSSPFRETNYTPEVFVTIPTSYTVDKVNNIKSIQFGYRHQSNGQDGFKSRSWNRLFLASFWQWDNLFLKIEGWYRFEEDQKQTPTDPYAKGDDNPDIQKYLGYGLVELKYLHGNKQYGLIFKNNLRTKHNKGSIQLDYSAPIHKSKNTYWYAKVFNGYGESLIDYNKNVTKISVGFAFYRSLF